MTHALVPNMQAPNLDISLVDGGIWKLSEILPKSFTMVIFYRGLHCPVCKMYLEKLNSMMDEITELGFIVVAVSMDSLNRAQQSKSEWCLDKVNVAYGLDFDTAKQWGLYISSSIKEAEYPIFCEPGLIWIRPDGKLYLIDISNMPWSRPDLEFLIPKAKFAIENNYPSRGSIVY
tara:strand:- start:1963 stop:2487 length:525 start_codon:yes stop_codon:yes gene_type:complete